MEDRGYTHDRSAYLKRAARIEGQVRGIGRMIENNDYCIDIITQIAAASSALHSLSVALLEEHIEHCVIAAADESPQAAKEKVAEATAAIARLIKS